jgi:hypothetical protein
MARQVLIAHIRRCGPQWQLQRAAQHRLDRRQCSRSGMRGASCGFLWRPSTNHEVHDGIEMADGSIDGFASAGIS